MSSLYDSLDSNRTRIPFNDLEDVLNDQLHVVSNLFTGICLFLRILLYGKARPWYSITIELARSGWVAISYSKDTSVILYLASGTFDGDSSTSDTITQS